MPIVLSQKEWARIKKWTTPEKEDPDAVRRREYVNFLDAASSEMTKSWPNSVENVNKRNEEQRLARIEAAEQENTIFYKRYLKRKQDEQEQLMYTARDLIFKSKDAPKLLLSAVIETAVQKERMEQIKFLNELRAEEARNKRQDDDYIIQQAKEWNDLMALRKQRRFEANKQHQKDILDQAHEVAERNRIDNETELNLQKIDNMNAAAEIKAIKEFEDNFREQEKRRILNDIKQAKAENEARKKEQAARDRMDDRLIEVLNKSRARTERKRKQTEADVKNEKLKVLEAISAKLESGDADRDTKDQAILDKAVAEKRAIEDARTEADRRKNAKNRQERMDSRDKFLQDEKQRIHEAKVRRQFEIMNRFKNAEMFKQFKEDLRQNNLRKVNAYRADILKLWKERDEREALERAATRYFYGELAEKKLRQADNKLLTHAAQLLQEAKEHGRPDYAIHRTIDAYCKMYRLYPMPPLYEPVAEHMRHYAPRDGSRVDPDYVEPPPPGPAPGEAGEDEHERGHKRDGVHDPAEAGPSKVDSAKPQKPSEEYKRIGPANGLQRREEKTTIAMVPCKNPDCRCELKSHIA